MSIIKLRTLTEKSKIGFGKYSQCTVGQIMGRKNVSYLRWIYYNFSGITFTDELLGKILYFEDSIIKKPGKSRVIYRIRRSSEYSSRF